MSVANDCVCLLQVLVCELLQLWGIDGYLKNNQRWATRLRLTGVLEVWPHSCPTWMYISLRAIRVPKSPVHM